MRVELMHRAGKVLFAVPDEAQAEIIALIDAVTAQTSAIEAPDLAAALSVWCWLVYAVHGDMIEVLDVGYAR